MRRVGNRLQLALKRWRRESKRFESFRARQRWAQKFSEYECVGGQLDGLRRTCSTHSVVPVVGGYYSVDQADCRLHFHAKAPVSSSWNDGL